MAEKLTDAVPSETSKNDINIAMEGLIISSDLESNDKIHNKNKEKPLPDEIASFTPLFLLLLLLLVKHGQSNTELQTLKNVILKIEAQMSARKSHVKCELSTLANKTEIMSITLWKTVNTQQERINKRVESLQQDTSYLQKELNSKNETIKSLLEV